MEYKITKICKYGKGIYQSEKIGTQYYNVVYAHLFRKSDVNRVNPIKVHFLHMFDAEDLWDFYNYDESENVKEEFSELDIKDCRNEMIQSAAESLFYGNDLNAIIEECNYTIKRYA